MFKLTKKKEFALSAGLILVVSMLGIYMTQPALTNILHPQSNSLVALTLYPNQILPCTFKQKITAFQTDGTAVLFNTDQQSFLPQISGSLVNPATGKEVNYFLIQPQLACTFGPLNSVNSAGYADIHPVLQGRVSVYANINYYDSAAGKYRSTPVANQVIDLGKVSIVNGQTMNLGSGLKLTSDMIIRDLPSGFNRAFALQDSYQNSLNFYIPELAQSSSFTGTIDLASVGVQVKSTAVSAQQVASPTVQFGCNDTKSICTYPLKATIHYTITYADGSTSDGDSTSFQTPKLLDLFKQTGNTQVPISSITLKVLLHDTNNLGISISNGKVTAKPMIQVGDRQMLGLTEKAYSIAPVNDINFGLATITISPSEINNQIVTAFGSPAQNPQQTTLIFNVDGTFDATYKGNVYHGTISGLVWSLDTMYGRLGSLGIGASTGGSQCQSSDSSVGINPNGLSPSSGQSFNCSTDETTCNDNGGSWDVASKTCTYGGGSQSSNNQFGSAVNSLGSTLFGNPSNVDTNSYSGLSGFCTDATSDQCKSALSGSNSQNSLNEVAGIPTIYLLGFGGFIILIIIIALARRR